MTTNLKTLALLAAAKKANEAGAVEAFRYALAEFAHRASTSELDNLAEVLVEGSGGK